MSVPLSERGMTKTEFFVAAYKLHDAIVRLLLHDMGVKAVTRDMKTFTYRAKMSQQDEATFKKLCNQYHIDVEVDFPSWLMDYYRENILHCLEDLMTHITNANSVYVDVKSLNALNEFNLRRREMWLAIGSCERLLQQFQSAIRLLPVDANKYAQFTEQIQKELEHLKNWKKEDNRILRMIEKARKPSE